MNAGSNHNRGAATTNADGPKPMQGATAGDVNDADRRARARRRTRMRWIRRGLLGFVGLTIAALVVNAVRPRALPVDLGAVTRGRMDITVNESGRTQVRARHTVSAPVAGDLARITLRAGDPVETGQVIARISPGISPLLDPRAREQAQIRVQAARAALKQAQAQVNLARVAHDQAQREQARQRRLFAGGAVTAVAVEQADVAAHLREQELSGAQAVVQMAQEDLRQAQVAARRDDTPTHRSAMVEVRSPAMGQVLRVVQESAAVVTPGQPLLEIGNPGDLEMIVDVLSTEAVRIPHQASVVISDWGGPPLQGRVRRIEPRAFTAVSALGVEEQRVNVIVDIQNPVPQWAAVGDGFRVETRILIWSGENILMAPASAVFRKANGWFTFRKDDGRARLQALKIGRRTADQVEVLEGLSVMDEVVLYPGDNVQDGTRITERRNMGR